MNLTRRISKYPLEYARRKRKKRYWLLIWLVSIFAACDVLVLFVMTKILLPYQISITPYLLPDRAQEYTHLSTFIAPHNHVNLLTFTPDGRTLACAAFNEIILWNVETGEALYTMEEHNGFVKTLTFSPDGKTIASSSMSNHNPVILCDTETGQVKTILSGHTSWIATLGFSPDGNILIGASHDGWVIAWDTNNGTTHQHIQGTFAFARRASQGYDYFGGPFKENMMITSWNRDIGNTDVVNTPASLISVLNSEAFEDDGIIAMTPGPNLLPIYLSSHSYPVQALAFSPDGKTLASGSRSEFQPFNLTTGKIHLWNVDTGTQTATLKTPGWRVGTLAFSPDGKTLASNGSKRYVDSQNILIWDLSTHRLISMIDTDSWGEITALAFAPDNITLTSGNDRGKVDLWDITGNIKNR